MARIEPHLSNPLRKRLEMTQLIREELAELTPLAMEKGVELELVLEEGGMWAEPVALAIALQNPVTNALNFSPVGGEVEVVIGAGCLSMEDQGSGIDEVEMERLFERLYNRGKANRAGLGLAIVEMVVGKIGCRLTFCNLD